MTSIPNSSTSHAQSPEPLIELRGVGMTRPARTVLSGVDLTVRRGDFIAVTGPNGGGKTTLLRIILRLLQPTEGTVTYLPALGTVGYLPQKNRIDAMFPISVSEVISSGLLAVKGLDKAERLRRVDEVLHLIGLESHAKSPIGAISGGQLQRTLLGRAIISCPDLLIMDEPLSYLDKEFEQRTLDLIAHMASHSTIILVSHDMTGITGMATRHLLVDRTVSECEAHHHRIMV